jgi:cyclopropane fatty-acyl-phospholipid synthase-like methyltransferase
MNTSPEQNSVQEIFNAWSVYDTVLENNYMFHNEIYEDVKHFLSVRYAQGPFKILDLGCGNARHLALALQNCSVACYRGYDLSEAAITQARHNLADLNCPIELYQGDLLEGLQTNTEKYDLIFSSFALHHLAPDGKAAFFELAYHALNEKGIVLLIDTAREENEDRPSYLNRYCGWLRAEWKSMSSEELDFICNHIQNGDFPETASGIRTLAAHARFSTCRELNQFRWHHTWCFEKIS